MVDRWLKAAGVAAVAALLLVVLLVVRFSITHTLHRGASYTLKGAPLSPPTVPQGTELPTYHHFTPDAQVRQLTPAPNPKTVHLAVELTHPSLQHLNRDSLYTVRLWLWDNHWRLLNRTVIGVEGAFDQRGRFQPLRAKAFIKDKMVQLVFTVPLSEWERTQNLLVTGSFEVGMSKVRAFEVLVPKSQVVASATPAPSPSFQRLPRAPRESKRPSRWRWWVIEDPPFQKDPQTSEWQRGAWIHCALTWPGNRARSSRSGWSQILVWRETENLSDQKHKIDIYPMAGYSLQMETKDRKFRYAYYYAVLIEVLSGNGVHYRWSSADGETIGLSYPQSVSFSAEKSLLARSVSLPLRLLHEKIDYPPAGWESRIFGDNFSYGGGGGHSLFRSSTVKSAVLQSSFAVVRVNTLVEVWGESSRSNRLSSVVSVYNDKPFCYLFLQGPKSKSRTHYLFLYF